MSQKNKTSMIIMFLLITVGILGSTYWWLIQKFGKSSQIIFSGMTIFSKDQVITSDSSLPSPPSLTDSGTFLFPVRVTPGTRIKISNSTTMALLNQVLKNGFEQQFPETEIIVNTHTSDKSIQLLSEGSVDIAAISRNLTNDEKSRGLTAILMAKDVVAIVIGAQNSFRGGLTQAQVVDIFRGKITNWSTLGRSSGTIQVINRPSTSKIHLIFEQLILKGENNGNTSDIVATTQDFTASIPQNLGTNGISYTSYSQVTNQQALRIVAIDDCIPEVPKYPYKRSLYYVYQKPSSEAVKTFLGYAVSPMGQQIINDAQ